MLKICKDGLVASDIAQYVDDVRIMAPPEELAWMRSSKIAKGLAFLGLQDAARKRRMPSQTPGAWAGATVSSDGTVVRKGVTKERWEKLKLKVRWIASEIGLSDEFTPISFGDLEIWQKLQCMREVPQRVSYISRRPNHVWVFWCM